MIIGEQLTAEMQKNTYITLLTMRCKWIKIKPRLFYIYSSMHQINCPYQKYKYVYNKKKIFFFIKTERCSIHGGQCTLVKLCDKEAKSIGLEISHGHDYDLNMSMFTESSGKRRSLKISFCWICNRFRLEEACK